MNDTTLAVAEELCASDRWDDAIALLTEANRAQQDDRLERALTDVRHRSWVQLTADTPGPQVEPAPVSPLVGESGLPEASFDSVTSAEVRAALLEHGSLYLPNTIEPALVTKLTDIIETALAKVLDPDDLEDRGNSVYFPLKMNRVAIDTLEEEPQPLRRRFIHQSGGVLLADSPRSMFELLEVYEALGLRDIIQDFLGDRPVMSANKCTLRKVDPDQLGGWHQDGAFLGDHIRAINIWLALSDCGVDAPGLDIVPTRIDHIVETGTEGAYFDWAVSDQKIEELEFDVVRPAFSAGDLVIFDEMMLHRTATAPTMTLHRHAIEFWCFAASTYPSGHIPLVW